MIALPDVNTLIALAWPNHVHHDAARSWFVANRVAGWATCALTEAGFVRVSCNRFAVGHEVTALDAIALLRRMRRRGSHTFWFQDRSITSLPDEILTRIQGYRQITDAVLVALAMQRGGRLATFDGGIKSPMSRSGRSGNRDDGLGIVGHSWRRDAFVSLPRCSILEVTPEHRDWPGYVAAINGEGQERWAFDAHFESFPRHFVMAKQDGHVVGFLMYVVWEIGPNDRGHRPLVVDGRPLTEAKIIAFGVKQAYRRQGIGRALQEHTLRRAKELGCYQVRSVSDGDHPENHRLKLAMGFAVEPMERDKPTLAFIMPLRSTH